VPNAVYKKFEMKGRKRFWGQLITLMVHCVTNLLKAGEFFVYRQV